MLVITTLALALAVLVLLDRPRAPVHRLDSFDVPPVVPVSSFDDINLRW